MNFVTVVIFCEFCNFCEFRDFCDFLWILCFYVNFCNFCESHELCEFCVFCVFVNCVIFCELRVFMWILWFSNSRRHLAVFFGNISTKIALSLQDGILDHMESRGVQYVQLYCVDNILVKIGDPLFTGYCIEMKAECANKVVCKGFPTESVGITCKVNGKYQVCTERKYWKSRNL